MIITADLFAQVMDKMNVSGNIVVGLSGGADSLCLTMLLNEHSNKNVFACIVDHKLRPTSSTEIIPITDILKQKDIKYCVKVWKHNDISGNLEQKARTARYNLLCEYCYEVGAEFLCTAHHALDQWETFFMRLYKGSGLRGLSTIRPISKFRNVTIFRPLLDFSPEDLKETLAQRFNIHNYVCDEMNNDDIYERVRWRKVYPLFKAHGLSTVPIGSVVKRLQNADSCLEELSKKLIAETFDGSYLNRKLFCCQPLELRMRILNGIVQIFKPRIVSYELLERMANTVIAPSFVATNFAGLVFRRDRTKNIKVFSEKR